MNKEKSGMLLLFSATKLETVARGLRVPIRSLNGSSHFPDMKPEQNM